MDMTSDRDSLTHGTFIYVARLSLKMDIIVNIFTSFANDLSSSSLCEQGEGHYETFTSLNFLPDYWQQMRFFAVM